MKLRGDYSGGTTYNVGDVVRYVDGNVYHLQSPCAAGVPPVDTHNWGRVNQNLQDAVIMVLDMEEDDVTLEDDLTQQTAGKKALDAHQGYVLKGLADGLNERLTTAEGKIPENISEDAITLKDAEDNEYLITVDASGETPELVVTLIEPEEPEEPTEPAENAGEGGES